MLLQLSSGQKRTYELMYNEMRKGSYTIKLPFSFPQNSVNILVKLILGDHAELINYNNCCVHFANFGDWSVIRLQPVFDAVELRSVQIKFENEVNRILRAIIKPKATSIQKILAIHDYLVANVVYDECDYKNPKASITAHTAYGAIIEKKAVCEGISYAFALLAQRVGIEATVVNGIVDGVEHSWNMIRVDSDCYHIDVTWDIGKKATPLVKTYDYFCLNDCDLCRRNWDKKLYPACHSTRYNYFNVTKSFAHNKQQMREIILRQYTKYKALYLRYDFLNMEKNEVVDYIWNELLSVAREHFLSIEEVTYSLNDDQKIFTLYYK